MLAFTNVVGVRNSRKVAHKHVKVDYVASQLNFYICLNAAANFRENLSNIIL